MKTYGLVDSGPGEKEHNLHVENLRINGFSILPGVLAEVTLAECRSRLDRVYEIQEQELGAEKLGVIKEGDLARCPLSYDPFFLEIALNRTVVDLAHQLIGGGYVALNLQNGIINRPNREHHQSSWHRDLPYQEFVSSKALAIGALYCIDDFTQKNGCTHVLPFSHRDEKFPSETFVARNEVPMEAPAGSVIVFDAMLFHRAGHNTSDKVRRGINHVYSIPIIKPQIDFTAVPHVRTRGADDSWAGKVLGIDQGIPVSVKEFREARLARLANPPLKKAL